MVLDRIKRVFSSSGGDDVADYLEIDVESKEDKEKKVQVRLFVMRSYDDVTAILDSLREGYTIAVIDIKTLRQKDPIELKRAISKIKKTAEALEGSIAGFGENNVIVTPSFAQISKQIPKQPEERRNDFSSF